MCRCRFWNKYNFTYRRPGHKITNEGPLGIRNGPHFFRMWIWNEKKRVVSHVFTGFFKKKVFLPQFELYLLYFDDEKKLFSKLINCFLCDIFLLKLSKGSKLSYKKKLNKISVVGFFLIFFFFWFEENFQSTYITVQNFQKIITSSLSVLCSPQLILTRSHQISDQNNSEAREPEGLVKITYGIVASSLFIREGNSN